MTVAWIGLGANLGDARATLDAAADAMAALPGTTV
jgi:2-amino-4-hydroxy-6-hydroxymethyldihydropteridine diphosphokinase